MLRIVGWLLSLVGVCTLAAMALPDFSPGPVIGAGGYLGAAGRGLSGDELRQRRGLHPHVSLILGGLLLCTDYVLIRILAWTLGLPIKGLGPRAWSRWAPRSTAGNDQPDRRADERTRRRRKKRRKNSRSGLPAGRGRRRRGRDEEEEEEDDEEEEEEEEHESAAAAARRKPVLPLLRIRKPKKIEREKR